MFSYVLIVVGLVLVGISFFVSERIDKGMEKDTVSEQVSQEVWTEKEEEKVTKRINSILSEKADEAVVRVDDQLSQISNEKIMAVNDFSDQLLEKINQNHSEVVFLYNMLGEKEEEIKKLMAEPLPKPEPMPEPKRDSYPTSKREQIVENEDRIEEDYFEENQPEEDTSFSMEDFLGQGRADDGEDGKTEDLAENREASAVDALEDAEVSAGSGKTTTESVKAVKKTPGEMIEELSSTPQPEIKAPMSGWEMVAAMAAASEGERGKVAAKAVAQAKETVLANEAAVEKAEKEAAKREAEKKAAREAKTAAAVKKVPAQAKALAQEATKRTATSQSGGVKRAAATQKKEVVQESRNERILNLYEKGNSILDISRELGLGQGEVKLVIDLFQQGVGR